MMENKDIDQLFRENFEDFSVTPPASLKQQIDSHIKQPNKYRLWICLSVFALILAISGLTYFFISKETKHTFTPLAAESNHSASSLDNNASNNSSLPKVPSTNNKTNAATSAADSSSKNVTATSVIVKHDYVKSRIVHKTETSSTKNVISSQVPKSGKAPFTKKGNSNLPKGKQITLTTSSSFTNADTKQQVSTTLKATTGIKNAVISTKNKAIHPASDKSNKPTKIDSAGKNSIVNTAPITSTTSGEETTASTTGSVNEETSKKDSLDLPSTAVKKDSVPALAQIENDSSKVTPEVDQNSGPTKPGKSSNENKNWLVMLQGGTTFSTKYNYVQNTNENIQTLSRPGYGFDLAFSRKINFGNLSYVGINSGYSTYSNSNHYKYQKQQVYTPNDSLPIYDSLNNIIGYYNPNSDTTIITNASSDFTTAINIISFGLQAQFDFNIGDNLGISVTPSFRYALNSMKNSDATLTNYHAQRMQFQLGLDLYYDWKQWRFMLGVNSRYLMNLKTPAFGYQERNRIQFMPQLGIGFKF